MLIQLNLHQIFFLENFKIQLKYACFDVLNSKYFQQLKKKTIHTYFKQSYSTYVHFFWQFEKLIRSDFLHL